VIILMADSSTFQTGGSTSLLQVAQGDTGCMNDTSPSAGSGGSGSGTATSASPSSSISGVGGVSGGGSGNGEKEEGTKSSTPTRAIVGGTLGGVAFIVLLALLLICCLKRRARDRRESTDTSNLKNYGVSGATTEKRNRFDILTGGSRRDDGASGLGRSGSDAETRVAGEQYHPSPFRYPSPPPATEAGRSNPPTSFQAAMGLAPTKESESRRSHESGATTDSAALHPSGVMGSASGTGAESQAGRTDDATIGHGVQRGRSTRKAGVPPSPTVSTPRRGNDELPATGEEEMRFVQHKDEGPIVSVCICTFGRC
jgi:hypothetical protein